MWQIADRLIDEFVADGRAEFVSAYGQPFPLLVIADLLGVPERDHAMFRALLAGTGPTEDEPWVSIGDDGSTDLNPLAYLDKWFTAYISERRDAPAQDILTELATQHFPDGTLPEVVDVVRVATFLFIAGHETTARLLTSALHILAENPELQNTLRNNRDRIPNFVEEVLRLESPIKSDFRLTRVATSLAGVDIPAGTKIMLLPGAANGTRLISTARPNYGWIGPTPGRTWRSRAACTAARVDPLARIEGRVTVERILDRLSDIRLDESHHGPPGHRRFDYVPLWILRGLSELHIEYTARS